MNDSDQMSILVVDDKADQRETVEKLLGRMGHEILQAATGYEALEMAKEKPDLIILDINLPDIDGFEVCRRLKANPVTDIIPVLHLSAAFVETDDRVTGLDAGADGYLIKPVGSSVLVATVQAMLRTRQIEKRLERIAIEAEAANSVKTRFLANVSHELRTPMNAIAGSANLLRDTGLNSEQCEHVDVIDENSKALLALIGDLLDVCNVDVSSDDLERLSFDLRKVVDDTVGTFSAQAADKGLSLSVVIDPAVPSSLAGDSHRLSKVLSILIDNALKFTVKGKVAVQVSLDTESDVEATLRFSVTDTGEGLSDEVYQNLFKPFSQADTSASRKNAGLGLGLAISKAIVQAMGGDIKAERRGDDPGSVFCFTVVLRKDDVSQESEMHEVADIAGCRVLVVDDVAVNRKVASAILKKLGCHADVAASGLEALEALKSGEYDVVLMDLQMPEMDGYEATKKIRESESVKDEGFESRVAIIALSTDTQSETRSLCSAAGMDDCLAKPVNPGDLKEVLAAQLEANKSSASEADVQNVDDDALEGLLVFDRVNALDRLGDDEEIFTEVVRLFLDELPSQMKDLEAAVAEGDGSAVAWHAHSIKGASGNIGAVVMQDISGRMEQAAKKFDQSVLDDLLGKLQEAMSKFWNDEGVAAIAAAPEEVEPEPEQKTIPKDVVSKERLGVVLVDDSTAMRKTLALLLKSQPVDIIGEASNGTDAVKLCVELRPDVVFLDVVMPGLSGIEVLEALHDKIPETKVIMLTSLAEREIVLKSRELGACDYVLKPFDRQNLTERVQDLFESILRGE